MLYNGTIYDMFNQKSIRDARHVMSGKDGMLFSADDGEPLASVETFQTQVNMNNQKYYPLGDAQEHEVFVSYGVTLTFTEILITDIRFVRELFEGMKRGDMPFFNFQGVIRARNGQWQRINYRQCVPSGNIDLQNLSVGEVIKRQWSFFVNEPPELQDMLWTTYGE